MLAAERWRDLAFKGCIFYTWYWQKPLRYKISHACALAVSVVLAILRVHLLLLRCIAARTSPYSLRHCSHSEFFRWKVAVFVRVGIRSHMLCESEFLRILCRCEYFTAVSIQFPFKKPFTKCMSVFFFCKCFRHWENLIVQNTVQPQPLAKATYVQAETRSSDSSATSLHHCH